MSLQMAEVQAKLEEVEKVGTDGRNEVILPSKVFLGDLYPIAVPPCVWIVWRSYTSIFDALFIYFWS